MLDENYQAMRSTLQSCLRSDGAPRPATSAQQVSAANRQCTPVQGSVSNLPLVMRTDLKDYIIGDQVLYVHPPENYNVHFPFRRGDLNIHSGVGGSLSAVLADLETIWGHCIQHLLDIPKSDLKVIEIFHFHQIVLFCFHPNRDF